MQWPPLRYADWSDTCETLHLWTQVVGKIRMEKTPPINHWWHVTLYITSRGFGTWPIPDGNRTFEIDFDFIAHRLRIFTSDGATRGFELRPMSVADFYGTIIDALAALNIAVKINTLPAEVADPIRFEEDRQHKSYDAEAVTRFWRVLLQTCQVMTRFTDRGMAMVAQCAMGSAGNCRCTMSNGALACASRARASIDGQTGVPPTSNHGGTRMVSPASSRSGGAPRSATILV